MRRIQLRWLGAERAAAKLHYLIRRLSEKVTKKMNFVSSGNHISPEVNKNNIQISITNWWNTFPTKKRFNVCISLFCNLAELVRSFGLINSNQITHKNRKAHAISTGNSAKQTSLICYFL